MLGGRKASTDGVAGGTDRIAIGNESVASGSPVKHRAIMDAAFKVFVQQGYAAASIDEIASATGVARQTVYNHFGDKERLFLAVVDRALEATLDQLRAATEGFPDRPMDVEQHLLALGQRIIVVFSSQTTADLRLLIQSEAARHPKLMALWQARSTTPVWSSLIGQLARLAHGGALSIGDPAVAAGQFVHLVTGTGWKMTDLGTLANPTFDPSELEAPLRANIAMFVRAYT